MQSITDEILTLRCGKKIKAYADNKNRHRCVACENDGSYTAYYFSTPIYNGVSQRAVGLKFDRIGNEFCSFGSNARITVGNKILMENDSWSCAITAEDTVPEFDSTGLQWGKSKLYPTLNGVAIKSEIAEGGRFTFDIEVCRPFLEVRANGKCFALMASQFTPLITCSCLGATDETGSVISPARIEYDKQSDTHYRLNVSPFDSMARGVLFEINLYDDKLFQDTTVESMHPNQNNAFGGAAFIGTTQPYGLEWLYWRPDIMKMDEIIDKSIERAILHIPLLGKSSTCIAAFKVSSRFCSFGSNWNNKVYGNELVSSADCLEAYRSVDITQLLCKPASRLVGMTEGLILKPSAGESGFCAIATGDCYFCPQILEVNYR